MDARDTHFDDAVDFDNGFHIDDPDRVVSEPPDEADRWLKANDDDHWTDAYELYPIDFDPVHDATSRHRHDLTLPWLFGDENGMVPVAADCFHCMIPTPIADIHKVAHPCPRPTRVSRGTPAESCRGRIAELAIAKNRTTRNQFTKKAV